MDTYEGCLEVGCELLENCNGLHLKKAPGLVPEERPLMIWTQDETTLYEYDSNKIVWMETGSNLPKDKSKGHSYMISGFSGTRGFAKAPTVDEEGGEAFLQKYPHLKDKWTWCGFHAGKNRDGWWENKDLIAQFDDVVKILAFRFPDTQFLFLLTTRRITNRLRPTDLMRNTRL